MSEHDRSIDEAYVLLKANAHHEPASYVRDLITVEAVYRSRDKAEQEILRLNSVDPDAPVEYWLAVSRLSGDGGVDDDDVDSA